MNIVLIGMRGAGKSTVGRLLAVELKMDFIDLDEMIAENAGKSVAAIVAAAGWPGFRKLESDAVRRVTQRKHTVLATGGGIVSRQQNLRTLKAWGKLVWLRADADTLYRRIAGETARPPLTGDDPETEMHNVLAAREPLYAAAADLKIDTAKKTAVQVTAEIKRRLLTGGGA